MTQLISQATGRPAAARLEASIRMVSRVLAGFSALTIAAMACLVVYSTVMRYFVGNPLSITEELASFLLVACIFLALPWAAVEGLHIKLTLLTSRLSPRIRRLFELATDSAAAFFFALLTKLTFDFAMAGYRLDAHSETSRIYELPWRAVMPVISAWLVVVLAFFCIKNVIEIARDFRG
jgi:TRAP-type C4-dicarboxylate transport system permease small subunit